MNIKDVLMAVEFAKKFKDKHERDFDSDVEPDFQEWLNE